MLTKFIIIAITMEAVLFQNKVKAIGVNECPRWVKLNTSPVCFGARGNQYGHFTNTRDISVSQFVLVHRSGTVSCKRGQYSYWGCPSNDTPLGVLLTDQQNKILALDASKVSQHGWYTLPGYTSSSSALVFCVHPSDESNAATANSELRLGNGDELRLWYGEDLTGFTEYDNAGKTCADVYALLV